ncbi:uncharacterized protein VSU04_003589 isoform 1-T1 [Chlamydotis macqueenii]
MKMCKTIPLLILLFTGYLSNNTHVAANTTTTTLYSFSSTPEVTQAPGRKRIHHRSDPIPEEPLSTLLVAGISISFVLLFILVIIGVSCVWKKSKGGSAEINSIPSDEPGVSLEKIRTGGPAQVAF